MADQYDDRDDREEGSRSSRDSSSRDGSDRRTSGRRPSSRRDRGRNRRRVCRFCVEDVSAVDYKNVSLLRDFVSERGRILSRRKSGACARHQRMVAKAIKRARHIALLPYAAKHVG